MRLHTKIRRERESYEEYWKFTAAFTDIHGNKFCGNLRIIINFIDDYKSEILNADKEEFSILYGNLTRNIITAGGYCGKDPGPTARKIINTYVKLGFIEPFLKKYHALATQYLRSSKLDQKLLFTRIFYNNASLDSSITKINKTKHIPFLLNTLDRLPSTYRFTKDYMISIMLANIDNYPKGYLRLEELDELNRLSKVISFDQRKYNQKNHLWAFINHCIDIQYDSQSESIYVLNDPSEKSDERERSFERDPYYYRIYREELKAESRRIYGKELCYVLKKEYKGLVASHIKPSYVCLEESNLDEAYDYNNGLLLSSVVDAYFDKNEISFDIDGKIMISKKVSKNGVELLERKHLDKIVLTSKRCEYLEHHRQKFKDRNEC